VGTRKTWRRHMTGVADVDATGRIAWEPRRVRRGVRRRRASVEGWTIGAKGRGVERRIGRSGVG